MGQSSSILENRTINPYDQCNETNLSEDKRIEDPEGVRAQDPTVHHNGRRTKTSPSIHDNVKQKRSKNSDRKHSKHKNVSITQLSKDEIKDRLDRLDLNPNVFRCVAKQEGNISENDTFVWYCSQQSSKGTSDLEESYMEIALYILSISPSVRNLRFKLVPSKLSEGKFWLILFNYICHGSEYHFEKDSTSVEVSNVINHGSSDEVDMTTLVQRLKLRIKDQEEEIQKLRMKADELKANRDDGMIQMKKKHIGKWVMDKEAIEFLSLEEEIKQQLREGKRKRMNELNEQMKFILDSDHIKDSRGKWDCCGKPMYCSECSC